MINELRKDIEQAKRKLINKAKRKGIYENFGQKELRYIEDKYFLEGYENQKIFELINQFRDFCETYTI